MIDLAITRIQDAYTLGGPVIAVLMAMSVLALGVSIWKFIVFEIEAVGRSTSRGFVARLLDGVHPGHQEANAMRQQMQAQLDEAFNSMSSGLRVLDLTAQVAPLLGLFGTVLGMIEAFQTLQAAGSTADPSVLAGGIWVALLTTAAGLVVAIPASLLLSWFDSRIETHELMARSAMETKLADLSTLAFARPATKGMANVG